jgi:hypothetical protein
MQDFIRTFLKYALTGCVLMLAIAYFNQRVLVFHPHGNYVAPGDINAPSTLQEIAVNTDNIPPLKAWYIPATLHPYTIVFFHGNAGTLAGSMKKLRPLTDAGYGAMLVEYPGFFGMPGNPSEASCYTAARAAVHTLAQKGVKMQHMVLMGHSLGTGIATRMASEFPVAGLVLIAPYTTFADFVVLHHPLFPAQWLLWDRFENSATIGKIHVPLLIVHGARDEEIPMSHSAMINQLAHEPKTYIILPDAGHDDLRGFGSAALKWLDVLPQH